MAEKNFYNDDNYIERAGELHEITVEITLAEYRGLIEDKCYNEKAIEELQEENEQLRKENEELKRQNNLFINKLYAENPEFKTAAENIGAVVRRFFDKATREKEIAEA